MPPTLGQREHVNDAESAAAAEDQSSSDEHQSSGEDQSSSAEDHSSSDEPGPAVTSKKTNPTNGENNASADGFPSPGSPHDIDPRLAAMDGEGEAFQRLQDASKVLQDALQDRIKNGKPVPEAVKQYHKDALEAYLALRKRAGME